MKSQRRLARRALLAGAWLGLCCATAVVGAAQFSLNQTRVHLDARHPVETLVLTNQETRPVSFEVETKRWRQDADGAWQLVPSDALLVHPLILTIPAGGQARLRIGTLAPAVAAEEAYRVELQQLPDAARSEGVEIKMLTRISVPVFLQPRDAQAKAALGATGIDPRGVRFVLANDGTGYFAPQEARLRLKDAHGRPLYEERIALAYALAGARLPVTAAVPAHACTRARRLELILDEASPPLDAPIADSDRRCGP